MVSYTLAEGAEIQHGVMYVEPDSSLLQERMNLLSKLIPNWKGHVAVYRFNTQLYLPKCI